MFNFVQCKSKIPDFEREQAKILTTPVRSAGPTGQADIHRVFRGLKSEPNEEIGQKGAIFKGLRNNWEVKWPTSRNFWENE